MNRKVAEELIQFLQARDLGDMAKEIHKLSVKLPKDKKEQAKEVEKDVLLAI